MPVITIIIPMPCSLLIFSFKKITAIIIVTIDNAEAIGVTSIASPTVNPQLTNATAAASKTPANKIIIFVLGPILVILTSRFNIKENNNRNKTMPIFTKIVVDNHPIFSEIISLKFQKIPKRRAAKIVSLTPDNSLMFLSLMSLHLKDTKVTPAMIIKTPRNWNVERR